MQNETGGPSLWDPAIWYYDGSLNKCALLIRPFYLKWKVLKTMGPVHLSFVSMTITDEPL
jgi:hypothetical protein